MAIISAAVLPTPAFCNLSAPRPHLTLVISKISLRAGEVNPVRVFPDVWRGCIQEELAKLIIFPRLPPPVSQNSPSTGLFKPVVSPAKGLFSTATGATHFRYRSLITLMGFTRPYCDGESYILTLKAQAMDFPEGIALYVRESHPHALMYGGVGYYHMWRAY